MHRLITLFSQIKVFYLGKYGYESTINDDKYFLKWFRIVQIFVLTFILISKNLLQDIFKDDRDKTTKNCIFQLHEFHQM